MEPKKVIQALEDPSWIEAMQEELLQFQLQKVWTLVNLPNSKRAIGTKWVFRNKKDERGIIVRNKAILVAQRYTQDKGIDYDEVFSPVARIEAIRLFLAYASFMGFIMYQMYVKSAFLYGSIDEEKFDFASVKTTITPMEPNKALIKDEEVDSVDVHLYRSMIKSLVYLTASRLDIMFAVCSCARFQVSPKMSHLHVVKRIFRYIKYQPKLGLWYPIDSLFDLEAFFDSDYVEASLDKKSTIGGCQFLGKRLISWQCRKQTIVVDSTTKAEYVVAANCCGKVLWIQNHMLDYGFNFMNTHIFIDNESTICIVKNLVFHSKTKHIEIRNHFIKDCYEKKLIQVIKIHTDHNVADLLTKAFDEWEDSMERADNTSSSLDAEQDSGSGPRCQDTILGVADAQTRFETAAKQSNDPPRLRGYTLGSGEDNMKLLELMELCTKLSDLALTVNHTIYTPCIEQFWATAKIKMVNGECQIQALVDKKKVIITESSIRSDLHLEDAGGTDCLPTATIFEELVGILQKS
ncbi:putative ribonuclease H-like domain-containing protein [Tanacetum coccineum]|uniref:Ribonuclease H-like domain-containing protein n=1 Tax=Tanacetum coccineum TaxID=301880 RepID=A0ABQ4Y646_9ASTR